MKGQAGIFVIIFAEADPHFEKEDYSEWKSIH